MLDFKEVYFIELGQNRPFLDSLFYALWVAFCTLFFSTLLFLSIYYLLFLLYFEFKKNISLFIFYFQIPLFLPYALVAMLFFLIFFPMGYLSDFIPFLLGSSSAIIIAYSYKVSAFLLFISLPNLLHVKPNEIKLHRLYSDSLRSFFIKIVLRRNLKTYMLGSFIVFAYIFNAYEIPYILGSTLEKMPAVLVYEQLSQFGMDSMQKAYFMSFAYFVLTLLFLPFFYLFYYTFKRVLS